MFKSLFPGLAAACALALVAGCIPIDVSNLTPYSSRIGSTYRLSSSCDLWAPKLPGGEYTILPPLPGVTKARPIGQVAEGTVLKVEAARRGEGDKDYLVVTLDDPAAAGRRIRATIQPAYLEGWPADR